jgi:hypothetical protein
VLLQRVVGYLRGILDSRPGFCIRYEVPCGQLSKQSMISMQRDYSHLESGKRSFTCHHHDTTEYCTCTTTGPRGFLRDEHDGETTPCPKAKVPRKALETVRDGGAKVHRKRTKSVWVFPPKRVRRRDPSFRSQAKKKSPNRNS